MHNPEVAERSSKNAYLVKKITTPSGNTLYLQGYEPFEYERLLKSYKEEEILDSRKDMPKITWVDSKGKSHRYFADFFIPKDNLVIEVKSTRTYSFDDKKEKIRKTQEETVAKGYNFKLVIYDNKGNIVEEQYYQACTK